MNYCARCDSAVNQDESKNHICDPDKVEEVRLFLETYDKIYGDKSALEVLTDILTLEED